MNRFSMTTLVGMLGRVVCLVKKSANIYIKGTRATFDIAAYLMFPKIKRTLLRQNGKAYCDSWAEVDGDVIIQAAVDCR